MNMLLGKETMVSVFGRLAIMALFAVSCRAQAQDGKVQRADSPSAEQTRTKSWSNEFHIAEATFVTTGRNRFFILEPGYQLVLEGEEEKVIITVTNETKMVGNVETRVVEEHEEVDGELAEISRNFFAVCKETGDIFYFGEEVDIYEDGKIVRHEGAWRADEPESKPGIIMPGRVLLGARYYQEYAPDAQDRAEHLRDDVSIDTPAGRFQDCLYVEETSGLNARERCYKTYAAGVGIVQDEDLLLTKYGFAGK